MTPFKMLVYSHDAYGLGNIRRMLEITRNLVESDSRVSALIISGSPMLQSFRVSPGIDYIKLPSVARGDNGGPLVTRTGTDCEETIRLRANVIMMAAMDFNPHLILVDKKPYGLADELKPAMSLLRTHRRRPKAALLLRDILDAPEATGRQWRDNCYHEAVAEMFDRVLVVGEPEVFDVAAEYQFPPATTEKLSYCGYIDRGKPEHPREEVRRRLGVSDRPLVVVSAGGGADGIHLTRTYLEGVARAASAFDSVVVSGPEMPLTQQMELAALAHGCPNVRVIEFSDDMLSLLNAADLTVSMGGYNTVCELLSLRKRAVVVPRVRPVQEQWMRAERMAARGLMRVVHPDALTPEILIATVREELGMLNGKNPAFERFKLTGLPRINDALIELLEPPESIRIVTPKPTAESQRALPADCRGHRLIGPKEVQPRLDAHPDTARSGICGRWPKRYLFQARNRRGLGHMMRGLNIAGELRKLDPEADILFYLRARPPAGFWTDCARFIVDDDPAGPSNWPNAAQQFDPDVVVYDTMLPDPRELEPNIPHARRAFVMRKCQAAEQRAVLDHPLLARIEGIVIPHTREQFGYCLPEAIAARARYVGPIIRRPDGKGIAAVRARYGLAPGDFVLVSTAGGGGFGEQTGAFFATVRNVHERLVQAIPRLRHIVVRGPNYRDSIAPLAAMTSVPSEPRLVDLFAACDLVIAEAGYNTVEELRITRTPAIFLPAPRRKDDQAERVRPLATAGLAYVYRVCDAAAIAQRILALQSTAGALAAMRERYGDDDMAVGNREAAEILFDLARP